MIKLYTDFKFAPDNIDWIRYNDIFFNSKITASMLTDKDLSLMKEIEGLILISKENSLFKSRTGIISITNISTSLKTLLNIRWLKRQSNLKRAQEVLELFLKTLCLTVCIIFQAKKILKRL